MNSTSPPPLDSNGLCHMSNYHFYLSRDFYYKTPTKMGSKGLQKYIWNVRSFKISISNGLHQSQTLLELKAHLQRTPMDSAYVTESFIMSFLQLPWTPIDSTICILHITRKVS